MTDEERHLLDEALGRASAALQLSRMLIQILAKTDAVLPADLMDAMDASVLAVEQVQGDPRANEEHRVWLREMRETVDLLSDTDAFRRPRDEPPPDTGEVRG